MGRDYNNIITCQEIGIYMHKKMDEKIIISLLRKREEKT